MLVKDCSFHMYASIKVSFVRVCSYNGLFASIKNVIFGYAGVKTVAFTFMLL